MLRIKPKALLIAECGIVLNPERNYSKSPPVNQLGSIWINWYLMASDPVCHYVGDATISPTESRGTVSMKSLFSYLDSIV